MEDALFIPEFGSPRRPAPARAPESAPAAPQSESSPARSTGPRRFRKGDAIAEIEQRTLREREVIEWSLVLNGRVVTTRQFSSGERTDYDRELHRVATDLAGSGWREETAIRG